MALIISSSSSTVIPYPIPLPTFSSQPQKKPIINSLQSNTNTNTRRRRLAITVAISYTILLSQTTTNPNPNPNPNSNSNSIGIGIANALDLSMTVPDQTVEEAESGIRGHAQSLVEVKGLLERESWREAQKELRRSSAYLKQDIYTLIQSKPGPHRPTLRKLYSHLFNTVTRLDYAARAEDSTRVAECFDQMVVALNDILSRLLTVKY